MSSGAGPYRGRLEVLAAGGVLEAQLDAWAARRSADRPGPWRRVRGKLRPQRSPWAVLVYEAVGGPTVQVRLLEDSDPRDAGAGGAVRAGDLGPVEIVSCAEDPALPGLPAVLAALDSPRVVRYHPGNRCTVRGGAGPAARYVKVQADGIDDQQEVRARWAASMSGALSFAVAEPHGWDEQTRSSWYGVVPGGPCILDFSGPMVPSSHVRWGRRWASSRRRRCGRPGGWTRQASWPGPNGRWRGRPLPPPHWRPGCGERPTRSPVPTTDWAHAHSSRRTGQRTSGSGWWTKPVGWVSSTSTVSRGVSRSSTWRPSSSS